MDDIAVALEHVNLLDGLDGLDVELLQRLLELLVIAGRSDGALLLGSAGSSLATARRLGLLACEIISTDGGIGCTAGGWR